MENKIITISDLHGHYDELIRLMYKIEHEWHVDFEKDVFIFLGDYVDGGYKSKQIIARLMTWQKKFPHWIFLKGNHEQMMVDAQTEQHFSDRFELWYTQGGKATALSYTPKKKINDYIFSRHTTKFIYRTHLGWVDSLPIFHKTNDYLFVHGGIDPELGLSTPANEMLWLREPFISSKRDFGFKVIFGHTVFSDEDPSKHLRPLVMDNKIGIDTMMHNSGRLTALLLPDEKFVFQDSMTVNIPSWN